MKSAGAAVVLSGVSETWLQREWFELGVIVNLGHGHDANADDANADIVDPGPLGAFRDLKGAVEAGQLATASDDKAAGFYARVSLDQLVKFAFDEKRRDKEEWAWARGFCERWAAARGLDIDELIKSAGAEVDLYRPRTPGRPGSAHIVEGKFRELAAAGQIEASLADQARVLRRWLVTNHHDAVPITQKTIQNRIRDEYKKAKKEGTKK